MGPEGVDASVHHGPVKIALLGSSTAFGVGPTDIDDSWAERYRRRLFAEDHGSTLENLSFPGFTSFNIQADDFEPSAERPLPSMGKNIDAALALEPTAIIINLPSNDQTMGFSNAEEIDNLDRVLGLASDASIPVWVTTTQPVRYENAEKTRALIEMRDTITERFAPRVIDFWTGLADSDNGPLPAYDSGDGTHLNGEAHRILAERVWDSSVPH